MSENPSTEEVLGLAEQPDRLVERLRKVAYGTTFLDVRADILGLIEREERGRLDQIAVCELLAKARAERDALLASKARLEEERDGWKRAAETWIAQSADWQARALTAETALARLEEMAACTVSAARGDPARAAPDSSAPLEGGYRSWRIYYDPPPIPVRSSDWHYVHDDYDGAPDANDNRAGSAASAEEARAAIDEWIEENFDCRCSAAIPDDCMALTCKWRRPTTRHQSSEAPPISRAEGAAGNAGLDELKSSLLTAETARDKAVEALRQAEALIERALPEFNWAASALSADAIRLLNETPGIVREALTELASNGGDRGAAVAERREESAWLIEAWSSVRDELQARWWSLEVENEDSLGAWTNDSNKALRFARARDAEAYIAEAGWTEAKPTEHLWTATTSAEALRAAQAHGQGGGDA